MVSKKIIQKKNPKVLEIKKIEPKINLSEVKKPIKLPIPEIKINVNKGRISSGRLNADFKIKNKEISVFKFYNKANKFSSSSSVSEMISIINKLKYFAKANNINKINIPILSNEYSSVLSHFGFTSPSQEEMNALKKKLNLIDVDVIKEIIDENHFIVLNKKNKTETIENKELMKYIPSSVFMIK